MGRRGAGVGRRARVRLMSGDEFRVRLSSGLAIIVVVAGVTCSATADASMRRDVLTLAQMCAGEARPTDLDACTAMVHVIRRRALARGVSISSHARAYSAVFRGSRPWLLELDARGRRPASWPPASWGRYRPQWMDLLAHVRAVLAGEIEDPCPDAVHFGSLRLDGHRMRDWDRVCPDVHDGQAFWGRL